MIKSVTQLQRKVEGARVAVLAREGKMPGAQTDPKFDALERETAVARHRLEHWERLLMQRRDIQARRKDAR